MMSQRRSFHQHRSVVALRSFLVPSSSIGLRLRALSVSVCLFFSVVYSNFSVPRLSLIYLICPYPSNVLQKQIRPNTPRAKLSISLVQNPYLPSSHTICTYIITSHRALEASMQGSETARLKPKPFGLAGLKQLSGSARLGSVQA